MPGQDKHLPKASALPATRDEMLARGWTELDVLIVTGDAYVDHPSFGAAMIARVLEAEGLRVGVVAQPDWRTPASLQVMGRPRLFCGVTAGNLDSMLANYTAARHKRREDDYSAGGLPGRRPNHAAVVYAQLARGAFPGLPVVLGGIEASLRRVAHYDYWEDKLRPSILVDSKADLLVYGMGESAVREIARRLGAAAGSGETADLSGIRGTARLLGANAARRPAARRRRRPALAGRNSRRTGPGCWRPPGSSRPSRAPSAAGGWCSSTVRARWSSSPPRRRLRETELDALYDLPFTRLPHPAHTAPIPAFTMIRDSVTIVRGCAGGCSFCGLGLHQGKFIASRSEASILRELGRLAADPGFRGTVSDLGGPSANLYGCRNGVDDACRACRRPSCLVPAICRHFKIAEEPAIGVLRSARGVPGVKHVFVQSGIRMDVALRTPKYLRELVRHHVSGHLKVAPEHLDPSVLRRMRKPGGVFEPFLEAFRRESAAAGKEQYLVPYFISSFPGCTQEEMRVVEDYLHASRWNLQQVQDFIPLPMTPAAAMYVTGIDYETGEADPRGAGRRRAAAAAGHPRAGAAETAGYAPRRRSMTARSFRESPLQVVRLLDEIVAAPRENLAGLAVDAVAAREQDPDPRVDLAQPVEGLAARETRHDHVEHDRVDPAAVRAEQLDGPLAALRRPGP